MLEPSSCTREFEMKRKQLLFDLMACAFVVLVLFLAFWYGGCAYLEPKAPGRPPAAMEQVLTWNAALAEANLGIAKGVIAANEAGEIDVPTSNAILTQQSLIADADRQLTPILAKACSPQKQIQACNAAILSGDGATIETFLEQIRTSASILNKSATAGIRNLTRKQSIDQAIKDVGTLIENIAGGLQQLGVMKTKTVALIYGTGKACTLDGPFVCLAEVKP